MMLHIPNVLTPEQVRAMRAAIDAADWVDGRGTVGAQGAQVKNNRQLPENSPVALEQGRAVLQALAVHPMYFGAALPLRTVPPLFNRYAGGETYGLHIDGAVRPLPHGAALRTDLSCTLFLCEPDDYEGGELVVVDTYGTHEVKLAAGDALVYPSGSVHQVRPVTRGERVASFLWTQSMVREDGKRAMLFDLDTHIQTLRGEHGDSATTVGLTAHYHNLLRMWAEV